MDPPQAIVYTPTRVKRNSKAPERFSSDDTNVDTSNNDISNSGKQRGQGSKKSSSSSATNKIQAREPLKVKLPKLKRPHSTPLQIKVKISRNRNGSSDVNANADSTVVTKIKLPSRPKGDKSGEVKKVETPDTSLIISDGSQTTSTSSKSDLKPTLPAEDMDDHDEQESVDPKTMTESNDTSADHDESMEDEINSSLSSDSTNGSAMQIIVDRKPEQNDSGIRCPCGVDDDLGVMVECESCSTWQHGHCINVGIEEDAYEGYVCGYCSLPPGKHLESLQQLTIGDKFQSKFEALEILMRNGGKRDEDKSEATNENQGAFTPSELETVVGDLKRVFTSLKVKWRLLTNEDYASELTIWKNHIWSDKVEENLKQKQQQTVCFVGEVYKNNLKLNICNMLNKMHRRCQLIRYQISRLEETQSSQSTFDGLLTTLDDISRVVEEYSDKLRQN